MPKPLKAMLVVAEASGLAQAVGPPQTRRAILRPAARDEIPTNHRSSTIVFGTKLLELLTDDPTVDTWFEAGKLYTITFQEVTP